MELSPGRRWPSGRKRDRWIFLCNLPERFKNPRDPAIYLALCYAEPRQRKIDGVTAFAPHQPPRCLPSPPTPCEPPSPYPTPPRSKAASYLPRVSVRPGRARSLPGSPFRFAIPLFPPLPEPPPPPLGFAEDRTAYYSGRSAPRRPPHPQPMRNDRGGHLGWRVIERKR